MDSSSYFSFSFSFPFLFFFHFIGFPPRVGVPALAPGLGKGIVGLPVRNPMKEKKKKE